MTTDLNFHDKISKLCFETYNTLPKSGKPKENEWTILSCIVLENSGKLEVIALGTGSKCIGRNKMSKDGDILNDSHAEVMCRRSFLRFIYENMLAQKNEIFIFDPEKQKFIIKDSVNFHFFSTHVPCGDAAIFAKQHEEDFGNLIENENESVSQNSFKRKGVSDTEDVEKKKIKLKQSTMEKEDIFRTGAKCLEGDAKQDLRLEGKDYHVTGVVRTKPGRGVPTLSVSCSDKLAKWCYLGLQGALLSILLDKPIYFTSFTVSGGTPYNEEAMKRALFNRFGHANLESPFGRNEVILNQANLRFIYGKTEGKNPSPCSVAWFNSPNRNTERQFEVAVDGRRQGVTKKQIKKAGVALKISKVELFKMFVKVIKQFEIKLENVDNLTYKQAKLCAQCYQKSWSALKKNFKIWTVKKDELLSFRIV